MKYIVILLLSLYIIGATTLAGVTLLDMYYGSKMTEEKVYGLCTAALTERLRCYCYESWGYECPQVLPEESESEKKRISETDDIFEASLAQPESYYRN